MNHLPDAQSVAAESVRLGRTLSADHARLLAVYLNLLVKWNSRMNLVGPSTWLEILETLIQDSWHLADLLQTLDPQPAKTLDLGAGAGLPGIPLRVFWDAGEYLLVEPRQKRAIFMEQAVANMGLPRTRVSCRRMEALPHEWLGADLVVSRAFMPWRKLLVAVRGLLGPDGRVLVMDNEEPDADADGYVRTLVRDYEVAGKKRWFGLFGRVGKDF
jgi:16S rRNA (guanine527-N7)-methyltransferase